MPANTMMKYTLGHSIRWCDITLTSPHNVTRYSLGQSIQCWYIAYTSQYYVRQSMLYWDITLANQYNVELQPWPINKVLQYNLLPLKQYWYITLASQQMLRYNLEKWTFVIAFKQFLSFFLSMIFTIFWIRILYLYVHSQTQSLVNNKCYYIF